MEKHVGLNPAWFEPGPDGVVPFEREMQKARLHCTSKGHAISAAFRALLAADAAQEPVEPPALQVGDVVRLEGYQTNSAPELVGDEATVVSLQGTRGSKCNVSVKHPLKDYPFSWHSSACTLIRRAGEPAPVDKCSKDAEIERLTSSLNALTASYDEIIALNDARNDEIARLTAELHARNDEIVGLRAEVERLQGVTAQYMETISHLTVTSGNEQFRADEAKKALARVTAERDALKRPCAVCAGTGWSQSRDGSEHLSDPVPCAACVNGEVAGSWTIMAAELYRTQLRADALQARIDGGVRVYRDKDYRWIPEDIGCTATGLLIDRELLHAQPIADAQEMVDDRVGKADRRAGNERSNGTRWHREFNTDPIRQSGASGPETRSHSKSDRRRTAGTRADRKGN